MLQAWEKVDEILSGLPQSRHPPLTITAGRYGLVLLATTRYNMVWYGMTWYCMVLYGIKWYYMILHGIRSRYPPLTITAGRLLVMKKNEKEEEGSKIKVNFQENVYAEIVLIYSYVFFFIDLYFYQFCISCEVSRDHMRRSTSQNKSGERPVLITFRASINISKTLKPSCRLKSKNIATSLNISKKIKSFRLKSKMFDSHMPWGYNALFSGEFLH